MNLQDLEYFIHVAKTGNLSQSAKALSISQPSLSRHIQQLEQTLGVALFDRYHRPMVLTSAGEFFFKKLEKNLQELYQILELTKHFEKPHQNLLTIGFVSSILYGMLPQIIATLKKQVPQLEVKLVEISSEQQLQALKNAEIDVGFGRFMHYDNLVQQIFLRHERFVVALPKTHPLASRPPDKGIHLLELYEEKLILYHRTMITAGASKGGKIDQILSLFEQQNLTPMHTTKVRDLQIALGLVAAGEGITFVPDSLKTVRTDQVHYHRLLHENMTSPIYMNILSLDSHPAIYALLQAVYTVYEEKGVTYTRMTMA